MSHKPKHLYYKCKNISGAKFFSEYNNAKTIILLQIKIFNKRYYAFVLKNYLQ